MPFLIQTKRLTLRPLAATDFPFVRSLHLNERMLSHSGGGPLRTEEQSITGFQYCLEIEKVEPRLGSWIVELKPQQLPIGSLILRRPATKNPIEGLEIGYSLLPEFWGLGLAQESARAMVDYARKEFGPVRMVALINPVNEASRNVLVKTGFISCGTTEYVDPSTGEVKHTEVLEIPAPNP